MPEDAINYFDITNQYSQFETEWFESIRELGSSGNFILGEAVAEFESRVAQYLNIKHAITVSSGTDALVLALKVAGVQAEDTVVMPDFTFFATAEAVSLVGATPVFVDIRSTDFNIDTNQIENAIQENTKALLPVHLFGAPANIDAICDLGKRHGIAVIEDAAQAFGARIKGKFAGTFGEVGCFSFYPTKILGAFGDGGMVVTNRDDLAEELRLLRNHGISGYNVHKTIGCTSRLNAVQAKLLQLKLEFVPSFIERRQRVARRYWDQLQELPLELPIELQDSSHVYNIFTIRTTRRSEMQEAFSKNHIGYQIYYPMPIHKQFPYRKLNCSDANFPESMRACNEVISLPNYPEMPLEHVDRICKVIHEVYS